MGKEQQIVVQILIRSGCCACRLRRRVLSLSLPRPGVVLTLRAADLPVKDVQGTSRHKLVLSVPTTVFL